MLKGAPDQRPTGAAIAESPFFKVWPRSARHGSIAFQSPFDRCFSLSLTAESPLFQVWPLFDPPCNTLDQCLTHFLAPVDRPLVHHLTTI